jgi:Protein of unknown function (DUF3775)
MAPALAWIGRGDFEPEAWRTAAAEAKQRAEGTTWKYLVGFRTVAGLSRGRPPGFRPLVRGLGVRGRRSAGREAGGLWLALPGRSEASCPPAKIARGTERATVEGDFWLSQRSLLMDLPPRSWPALCRPSTPPGSAIASPGRISIYLQSLKLDGTVFSWMAGSSPAMTNCAHEGLGEACPNAAPSPCPAAPASSGAYGATPGCS